MTNLIDLNQSEKNTLAEGDVCIIGAGAAGLYLADRLAARGLSVALLEAGGKTCVDGETIGIKPDLSGSPYRGAVEGRAFGWGGTTSRWGGALVPHSVLDFRNKTDQAKAWQHIVKTVQDHSPAVFTALGLQSKPDFFSYPSKALGQLPKGLQKFGWETIATEFLPFQRRKLTYLLNQSHLGKIQVYLNAVVAAWEFKTSGKDKGTLASVGAVSDKGNKLTVKAKSFVIAAGTIESTRMLLEIDLLTKRKILPRRAALGRYLSDHLSCAIARVPETETAKAIGVFGPRFSRGRMRNFRFIEAKPQANEPRHFTYFLFKNENPGFALARKLLFGSQAGQNSKVTFSEIWKGLGGLLALAYYQLLKSSLYIPSSTPVYFQLDIEQAPHPQNRVTLGKKKDRYGRSVASIHWRINQQDHQNIRNVTNKFLKRWPGKTLGLPGLEPIHHAGEEPKPYDIYHPVGTCRMGTDPRAVVDLGLRVHGTQNLSLLSTAVFPTAGTANPTFSMLCLGNALADKITDSLSKNQGFEKA